MLAGILMLIRGGNWTIDSSVYVAHNLGISPLVVGFTIIAFGTSLPELVVSVIANMQGSAGIAIGNVVGSNIANILMVIGATATFVTLKVSARGVYRDLIVMLLCTGLLGGLLFYGSVGQIAGAIMVALLVAYILYQFFMAKSGGVCVGGITEEEIEQKQKPEQEFKSMFVALGFLLIGLIAIALGAEFLVRGAKVSAGIIGVPEAVVALSIIAFGTSLPELSTCIIAGKRGHGDIVLGNIIGSNVFNILMIIGITALVKPIAEGSFAPQLADFDIWIAAGVSVLFAVLLFTMKKITKPVGYLFMAAYIAYNIYIYAIYMG